MGCSLTGSRFNSNKGTRDFSLVHSVNASSEASYCPVQWVPELHSSCVQQPRCNADYSPPSSAESKNVWGYNFLSIHFSRLDAWLSTSNLTFSIILPSTSTKSSKVGDANVSGLHIFHLQHACRRSSDSTCVIDLKKKFLKARIIGCVSL